MIHSDKDPIIAPATPAGRGGIGVLRLSFAKELESAFVKALFGAETVLKDRYARYLPYYDGTGALLDRLIVLLYRAPHSYTGETVIELQAHGGPMLMSMLLKSALEKCRALSLRMAEPGEFTKRAFLNGKLDLAQAEAVADLIDAASESAVRAAGRSLSGEFSGAVRAVAGEVNELRAYVEAVLDFPEEEVDPLDYREIDRRADKAAEDLGRIIANARQGAMLREGVTAAIVGSPNVGKSSLLNALAQEDVAIVTDVPGTTRDRIEHWVSVGGVPVKIVDTAGIRETSDRVEAIGIDRALAAVRGADVVLHLRDASGQVPDDPKTLERVLAQVQPGVDVLTVFNKCDLCENAHEENGIYISARTGEGLGALKEKLLEKVGFRANAEGLYMARERHLECLRQAAEHLAAARSMSASATAELLAEELRLAGRALGMILGETTADDILGMIFSKFCIGK
ncbi:MAG: tRNA uridine-5-carboxymethylaminomethyl(34) synthesis GTPase MnmE [Eubacterium sp.]|jgi:tRNA modification GTPase